MVIALDSGETLIVSLPPHTLRVGHLFQKYIGEFKFILFQLPGFGPRIALFVPRSCSSEKDRWGEIGARRVPTTRRAPKVYPSTRLQTLHVPPLCACEISNGCGIQANRPAKARDTEATTVTQMAKKAEPVAPFPLIVERLMNIVISRIFKPHDRTRYSLERVNRAEMSWSARELFFLVKTFFPAETRFTVSNAAATLCAHGELSISGTRYTMKSLKPS